MNTTTSRVRFLAVLGTALALGAVLGAGMPRPSQPSVSARTMTTIIDGPNVACTAQIKDALVALTGNSNPTETVIVNENGLVVKRLAYAADAEVLYYELPGVPLDAAGTILMVDHQALGAFGYDAYWCDESHVMNVDYLEPGDGSYPSDIQGLATGRPMTTYGLMGCDSMNTSICKVMAPLFTGVVGLVACTPGKVISIAHNICEGLKALIRFVRDRWNRGPNPDSWSCPTTVACDAVSNSCLARKWACRAMKINNVCWDQLGCQ